MADTDVDPSDFLQKIRELGEKRDMEDAERFSKLEEQIAKDRSERLARRQERARSLSPEKFSIRSTPLLNPSSLPSPESSKPILSPTTAAIESPEETREMARDEALARLSGPREMLPPGKPTVDSSATPDDANTGATDLKRMSSVALARSGTLSWQQRPSSRDGRRPLSVASRSPLGTPPASPDKSMSREDIAASLSSKDPNWFKQTSDRGIGNAALRRGQENEDPATAGHAIGGADRFRLPGMSPNNTSPTAPVDLGTPSTAALEPPRSPSPTRTGSIRANPIRDRASRALPLSTTDSPKFTPPSTAETVSIFLNRPPSPTKGAGGFVQSAMLKRSDSVSKRWSATPGLSRTGSTASATGRPLGHAPSLSRTENRFTQEPQTTSRPNSRPTSSYGALAATAAPTLPEKEEFKSPPPSPSKRWSPTKASWLDSALERKESPKPREEETQPAWMAEIAKAKQQKAAAAASKAESVTKPVAATKPEPLSKPFGASKPEVASKPAATPMSEPASKPSVVSGHEPASKPIAASKPEALAKPVALSKPEPSSMPSATVSSKADPKPAEIVGTPSKPPTSRPISTASTTASVSATPPSTRSNPTISPKPTTSTINNPPPTDFRAQLKSRAARTPSNATSTASSASQLSEFQSAAFKLKRTETKNYVAPDTFRENILRGKAGLSITGGPKPRERKDELKDDILKKKEEMRQKVEEHGSARDAEQNKRSSREETPEALVISRGLGRGGSIRGASWKKDTGERTAEDKEINDAKPPVRSKSALGKPATTTATPARPWQSQELSKPREAPPVVAKSATIVTERPASRNPKPASTPGTPPLANSTSFPLATSTTTSLAPSATEKPISKLAGRFNPGLAAMLARGPPGAGGPSASSGSATPTAQTEPTKVAELTHMTKGRARGPKRRAPKTVAAAPEGSDTTSGASVEVVKEEAGKKFEVKPALKPTTPAKAAPKTASKPALDLVTPVKEPPKPATKPALNLATSVKESSKPVLPFAEEAEHSRGITKPAVPSPMQTTSLNIGAIVAERAKAKAAGIATPPLASPTISSPSRLTLKPLELKKQQSIEGPFSPKRLVAPPLKLATDDGNSKSSAESRRDSQISSGRQSPVKDRLGMFEQRASQTPAAGVSSPTAKPEPANEEPRAVTSPKPVAPRQVDTLNMAKVRSTEGSPQRPSLGPKRNFSRPMAVPPAPRTPSPSHRFPSHGRALSSQLSPQPQRSPSKAHAEANMLLGSFFDLIPTPSSTEIDALSLLQTDPFSAARSHKTVRSKVALLSPTGKISTPPSGKEHVLSSTSISLILHWFTSPSSPKEQTEAYLWLGSAIPASTAEDVQVFGRKAVRELGGAESTPRTVVTQGKEPPSFFAALGGVAITFNGAVEPSIGVKKGAFLLCARRHLGHVTFDETAKPISVRRLCNGFAYLAHAPEARTLFLWKGRGAHAEEVGCARLIAMDLAVDLGAELAEVAAGEEDSRFLALFDEWRREDGDLERVKRLLPRMTESWRQKPLAERWGVRCFRVSESGRPGEAEVKEVAPCVVREWDRSSVWVVDGWCEIYVLPGPATKHSPHLFTAALQFAYDYSILAVSVDDRPFVPVGTVVLEGFPRDLKDVVRGWEDGVAFGGAATVQGRLKVLGLSAAVGVCLGRD